MGMWYFAERSNNVHRLIFESLQTSLSVLTGASGAGGVGISPNFQVLHRSAKPDFSPRVPQVRTTRGWAKKYSFSLSHPSQFYPQFLHGLAIHLDPQAPDSIEVLHLQFLLVFLQFFSHHE